MGKNRSALIAAGGTFLVGAALLLACKADPAASTVGTGNAFRSNPTDGCQTPAEGCACDGEGSVAACGSVERRSGAYVTCSIGQTQCVGGHWGACVGDRVATRDLTGDQGLHIAGLGVPGPCLTNPCDPSCLVINDNGAGLDAGAALLTGEGGLSINPSVFSDAGIACTGLTISPASQAIVVTGLSPLATTPATPTFSATFTPAACAAAAAPAAWDLDTRDRAGITSGQLRLVSAVAGPIALTAYSAGYTATAAATVTVDVNDTSTAPTGTASKFVGAGTQADGITVLFPYGKTVFPRAVAAPLVQWNNGGTAASAVKVTLRYPSTGTPTFSVAAIVAESSPPRYQLPQDAWAYLDQTAAGQDALIVVQRLVGSTLRNEVTIPVHFASQPLRGNIFYTEYNVPNWTGDIKTAKPFGTKPAASAFGAGAGCVPCHSVAANGTTVVTANWGSTNTSVATVNGDGTLNRISGSSNSDGTDSRGFAYSAISPDGTLALQGSNWWGNTLDGAPSSSNARPHGNGSGLTGSYYSKTDLSGGASCTRNDTTIDFAWGTGAPASCLSANATYSVAWDGFVQGIFSETYTFDVTASDGVRLYVNGSLVIDKWLTQTPATTSTGTAALTSGKKTSLRLEYKNVSKTAGVHLGWTSASQPHEIISTTQLYPKTAPSGSRGLLATYYSNIDFTGTTGTRVDEEVNFDWSHDTLPSGIGPNNFSVEWTGQIVPPCSGTFQLCTYSDDGARLWVGTSLAVDAWYDQGSTYHCANVTLTSGQNVDVKMDYYQKGGGAVSGLWWGSSCQSWNRIDKNFLVPTGDTGKAGCDQPFKKPGDRGTGSPYKIFKLSTTPNVSPVDVSSNVASAWGLGTTAMLAPAFAPDGKSLIFIDGDTSAGASWRQGLSLWSFDQAQSKFSGRTNVVSTVASNLVIRWPTVESDSRSVIYQTNPTSSDDTSYGGMLPSAYGNIPGRLWSVDAKDPVNHPPVALDTINTGLGGWEVNRSYQPTVLPTAIGGYRWAVFTSTRAYGNTLNSAAPNTTQLWVAALDDTTSATTDRSHPPFWLPNQTAGDDSARIRNERAYWVLDACHPSIAGGPAPAPAPAPTVTWSDQDIGNVGAAGSATSSAGTTTVKASGDDIWNNADAFHYVSTPVTGDIRIVARINGLSWTSSWAKAGVMIRDARTSGASHAFMMVTAAGTSGLEWRSTTSASSAWTSGLNVGLPYWVRVTRVGTTITGDVSSDGVTWFNVGTSTPTIGTNAYIGLAATAQNNGALTTAVFDNVSVTVPSTDTRVAATCQDDADCCGAQSSPKTSACTVDTPVTNPPTRHCITLSKQSCTALGGACASDSECCSFPNNRCNAGVCSPPPPVSYYPSVTYTRDYTAVCARGLWPVWRFFDWEDVTPGDSSIAFSAAVATTAAGLDSATALPIGTASGATNLTWIGVDVGTKLASVAPPLGRGPSYLRITMAFNPTSDHLQSPLLTAWRQSYSCVPSE